MKTVLKHDYNVGYDFNHESEWTRSYMDRILAYWIEEYNIDGYRIDLSKGLTQKNTLGDVTEWGKYDASRVAILTPFLTKLRRCLPPLPSLMTMVRNGNQLLTKLAMGMQSSDFCPQQKVKTNIGHDSGLMDSKALLGSGTSKTLSQL